MKKVGVLGRGGVALTNMYKNVRTYVCMYLCRYV